MRFSIPLIACSSIVLAHEDDNERIFDRFFDDEDGWHFHEHADYESRYATEGRDALDGDSLVSGTFEAGWNAFSAGVWYAKSPDQSYDELQLSSAVSWDWKDLEGYVAYTHLRFPQDGGHDHEIGAGVSWAGLPAEVALGVDANYSFDADGAFIVTSLSREFELNDRFQLTPAIVFGMNQGYVSDGHDGANHFEFRLGGACKLTDAISFNAHLSYRPIAKNNFRNPDKRLVRLFESVQTSESLVRTSYPIPKPARSKSWSRRWIAGLMARRSGVSMRSICCCSARPTS